MRPVLWKYFFRRNAQAAGVVWLAATLILVLFEMLRRADDEGALAALLLALLRAPAFALDGLPFACALGAALAVCGMVSAGEMPVLRAAGLSATAAAGYNAAAMLLFAAAGLFIGEFLLPAGASAAAALKNDARAAGAMWLKDGGDYIRVGKLRLDGGMENIVIYHTQSAALLSVTSADSADYVDGAWNLNNIRPSAPADADGGGGAAVRRWALPVRPSSFETFFKKPRDMSMSALFAAAEELTAAGQDARPLWGNLWRRWEALLALPLLAAAAVWVLDGGRRRYLTPLAALAAALLAGLYYFGSEIAIQTALVADFSLLLLLPPLALAAVVGGGIFRRGG